MANISVGTPGMAATIASPMRIQMPGAVPPRIVDHLGPFGKIRLHLVALRHGPLPAGEHVLDMSQRRFVQYQLDAGRLGQHLARQIIERRPQPAGDDDEPGPLTGDADRLEIVGQVVGDGRVPADRDADLRELQAEPLAVGIEVLAGRQLGADGDDFCLHGGVLSFQFSVFRKRSLVRASARFASGETGQSPHYGVGLFLLKTENSTLTTDHYFFSTIQMLRN